MEITTTLQPSTFVRLKMLAEHKEKSENQIIEEALGHYLYVFLNNKPEAKDEEKYPKEMNIKIPINQDLYDRLQMMTKLKNKTPDEIIEEAVSRHIKYSDKNAFSNPKRVRDALKIADEYGLTEYLGLHRRQIQDLAKEKP